MAIDPATVRELKQLDKAGGGGLFDELVGLFASGTPRAAQPPARGGRGG